MDEPKNEGRRRMNEKYRIEEAATQREEAEAKLYRDDGSKVYGEQEHRERLAAIRAEYSRAFDRIDAAIEERVEQSEGELVALEHADPAGSLSTEELQRAAAMSGFVGAEVDGLSTQNLVRRVRAAASSGDRAAMYALQHHAARRVDADLTGEIRGGRRRTPSRPRPGRRVQARAGEGGRRGGARAEREGLPRPARGEGRDRPLLRRGRRRGQLLDHRRGVVMEDTAQYMTAPTTNGDKPLPRRVGTRSMLPSTWISRSLRVEYVDASGKAATTEGVLLDWCPVGMLVLIAGAKTLLSWDRLVLIELTNE